MSKVTELYDKLLRGVKLTPTKKSIVQVYEDPSGFVPTTDTKALYESILQQEAPPAYPDTAGDWDNIEKQIAARNPQPQSAVPPPAPVAAPTPVKPAAISNTTQGKWSPLELQLFPLEDQAQGTQTGTGKGEYATAAMLVRNNPDDKTGNAALSDINIFIAYVNEKGLVLGGNSKGIDVSYNNKGYEVKNTNYSEEARIGAAGTPIVNRILNAVHTIIPICQAFNQLPIEVQAQFGVDFKNKLDIALNYFTRSTAALPSKSLRSNGRRGKDTPDLEGISAMFEKYLKEEIETLPLTKTANAVKQVYDTSDANAKLIDAQARDIIKNKGGNETKTAFDYFLIRVEASPYKNVKTYKEQIQDYFNPGTELHDSTIEQCFAPAKSGGLYVVNSESYMLVPIVGKQLAKYLQINRITGGQISIGDRGAPTQEAE